MQAFSKVDAVRDFLRWRRIQRLFVVAHCMRDTLIARCARHSGEKDIQGCEVRCEFCAIVMAMTLACSRLYLHVVMGVSCRLALMVSVKR